MPDGEPAHLVLDVDALDRRMLQQVLSDGSAPVLADQVGLERRSVVRPGEEPVVAGILSRVRPSGLDEPRDEGAGSRRWIHLTRREAATLAEVLGRVEDELGTGIERIEESGTLMRRAIFAGKAQAMGRRLEKGLGMPGSGS